MKVTVNLNARGNRIEVWSKAKIKALQDDIPGANFARTGGSHWTVPLTIESCKLLRERFGKRLVIGPELRAWALAKNEKARTMTALGKAESAELPGLWLAKQPKLWKAVTKGRKYQSAGARFISDGLRVIVSDGVGLGKTAQTFAGILDSQVPGPYLVVCPKTAVMNTWKPEVATWLKGHRSIAMPEGRDKRNALLDAFLADPQPTDWVIVNQDMLRTRSFWSCMNWVDAPEEPKGRRRCGVLTAVKTGKKELDCEHDPTKTKTVIEHEYPQLFRGRWGAVVADEAHKCLLISGRVPSQTRRGMDMLRVKKGGLKIAQSATPWRSRPHLLWSTLNWLYPDEYTAKWAWIEIMYEVDEAFRGGPKAIGKLNAEREKLLYRTLNSIMIRRTRREVAKHLPPRLYIGHRYDPEDETSPLGIWLPMEGKQAKAYRQMEDDAVAEVQGGEVEAIGALAELTRCMQFASSYGRIDDEGNFKPSLPSNKFDYLVDLLLELGFPDDPTTKVIVVSKHTALLELFAAEIKKQHKIDSLMLTGKTSVKKREEVRRVFNDPEAQPHLLFLNTIAGGTAITLDAADEMVFLDESWVADDQEQVEGRNDNRRPEEKIVQRRYRYLRSLDTVEVGLAFVNGAASAEDRRLLDERRGVQYVVDVLEETFRQAKPIG